jgi:hypothetical protein
MRAFSVLLTRATSSLPFVGLGLIAVAAMPGSALSQGGPPPAAPSAAVSAAPDSLIEACYVATTGAVYLINEPGLKTYCALSVPQVQPALRERTEPTARREPRDRSDRKV